VLEPLQLADRIRQRQLDLVFLRDDTLRDVLDPLRLEYLQAIIAELEEPRVNREFSPVCYLHGLVGAAAQWHPELQRIIATAGTRHRQLGAGLVAGLVAAGFLVVVRFWTGRPRYRAALSASLFVQGVWGIVLQLVLILAFQILEGFAYLQLAIIIAFFMAGLALGAMWVAWVGHTYPDSFPVVRRFVLLQACVTLYPLAVLLFLSPVCDTLRESLSSAAASWVFTGLSLIAGSLAGAHFSLAALASVVVGAPADRTGGWLYAVDLAGAAVGALTVSLLVLPLFGIPITLLFLSAASLVCLLAVLRQPPSGEVRSQP
jgi:spermidine synthase